MNSDLPSSFSKMFTGSAPPEPIARWNTARCAWETTRTSLFCEHSGLYRETFPPSGMQASGILYELPTSVPRTGGSESSFLPTPTATLNAPAPWKPGVDWWLQSRATRNLEGVVTGNTPLLPTPVARDYMGLPGDNVQMASLPREISLLPTPSAGVFNDGEDLGSWRKRQQKNLDKKINGNGQGLPLAIAAVDEVNWGRYSGAIFFWEKCLARKAPLPTEPTGRNGNPRLSPRFVEWMQGLPEGWVTGIPGLSRKGQLHSLGNGVVPQQAEMALRLLLARIPENDEIR